MDKTLNFCISMLFVFLTILSLALMGGSYAVAPTTSNYFYLKNVCFSLPSMSMMMMSMVQASESSHHLFLNFFTNLMLLNTFIPLSLMVTLEVSIFLQVCREERRGCGRKEEERRAGRGEKGSINKLRGQGIKSRAGRGGEGRLGGGGNQEACWHDS
eukprot:768392-Hanusia_phi.AAC.3